MKSLITAALMALLPILSNAQELSENVIDSSEVNILDIESFTKPAKQTFISKSAPYIAPAAMFAFGVIANKNASLQYLNREIRDEVLEKPRGISTKVEDYLQYAPAQAVFALNMVGIKSQNNFVDRLFLYGLSNTIMSQTVSKLKSVSKQLRPDGGDRRSFPSGHTATAFSAAEFMRLEYKDASPIYGIVAYTAAAATGALRIYHNKHWFSDVIAGAGVGILSTDLSYFIYPKVKKFVTKKLGLKPGNVHIGPTYQSKTVGVGIVYNPK